VLNFNNNLRKIYGVNALFEAKPRTVYHVSEEHCNIICASNI